MDLSFVLNFAEPLIVVICLCIGYILKNMITTDKINNYIPAILSIVGLIFTIWSKNNITPEIVATGLFSGLAATGSYEAFKNIINALSKNQEDINDVE